MGTKGEVRRSFLALRDSMDPTEIEAKSRDIGEKVLALPAVKGARRIGLYASIRNEVRTEGLFERLRHFGKEVFYPRVAGERVEFVAVRSLSVLTPGRWGIREPRGEEAVLDALEVIIVPGVAFDLHGHRVGFGKGYYDRTLRDFRGGLIGLAYDFQIVEAMPVGEWDLVCDQIVTERRLIEGRRALS